MDFLNDLWILFKITACVFGISMLALMTACVVLVIVYLIKTEAENEE